MVSIRPTFCPQALSLVRGQVYGMYRCVPSVAFPFAPLFVASLNSVTPEYIEHSPDERGFGKVGLECRACRVAEPK